MQERASQLREEREPAPSASQSDRASTADVLARLSLRFAPLSDDAFLSEYACAMQKELGAEHFLVGRFNPYSNIMRTVRYYIGEKVSKNFTYSLDGTPCERAIDGDSCIHPDNVATLFPRDKELREMNIRGYAGTPLRTAAGDAIGIIVALTEQPIADPKRACLLIEYFRARVATTLEKTEIRDRYAWAVSEASDGVWDWDVLTGGTTISRGIQTMLGYDEGGGPYDLTQIEQAIHDEDRSRHVEALQKHLNSGAPFDVKIRLCDRTGVYRWFRSRGKAIRNDEGKPIRMIGCFIDIHDLMVEAQRRRD